MVRLLLFQVLFAGVVWLVKCNPEEVTAPVVWKNPRPFFLKRGYGSCELTTTRDYEIGQFTVNLTFESTIYDFKFKDYQKWNKVEESRGNWYVFESRFAFDAGQEVDLEFSGRGHRFRWFSVLPDGECRGVGDIDECIDFVDFQNIRVIGDNNVSVGKGRCVFTLFENVTAGALTVNVTFSDQNIDFTNRHLFNLTASNPGFWYFSESTIDYFVGDVIVYEFDVSWDATDFPTATCLANIACNDVDPTTTTTTEGAPLPPIS